MWKIGEHDRVTVKVCNDINPGSCGMVTKLCVPLLRLLRVLTCALQSISPVVSEAMMGSEVASACIVIRLTVYGVEGNNPWIRDAVLEPSSVTLDVSVPSEEL